MSVSLAKFDNSFLKYRLILYIIFQLYSQVTRWTTQRILKRAMWEKELGGTLKPQASFELKQRAASVIQKVIRQVFQ